MNVDVDGMTVGQTTTLKIVFDIRLYTGQVSCLLLDRPAFRSQADSTLTRLANSKTWAVHISSPHPST